MRRLVLFVLASGCGRLGFDATLAQVGDAPGSDAPPAQLERAELVAPNADPTDLFGNTIAVSRDGSTIAIGAPQESSASATDPSDNTATGAGAVYVFTRTASTWQLQAYLKQTTPVAMNFFGASVALSGDGNVLAVGTTDGDAAAANAGEVDLFTRSGTTWTPQQVLVAAAPDTSDLFGFSVALSADASTVVVGAPNESSNATTIGGDATNNAAAAAGAAYVFVRAGQSWQPQAYLKAPTAMASSLLGQSVTCSDDGSVVAAAAPSRASDQGAVEVFRSAGTTWSQDGTIPNPSPTSGDFFGYTTSLSGDGSRLVAGAPGSDVTISNGGAVSVFTHGTAWTLEAPLAASNAGDDDQLGVAVAISGDGTTLLAGASLEDSGSTDPADNSTTDAGAAYRYTRAGMTWSQVEYLKRATPTAGDHFGFPVALSADASVIAIGATSVNGSSGAVTVLYFGQ